MKRQILKTLCVVSMVVAGSYAIADDNSSARAGYGMMGGGYGMGSGMMGGGYGMGPGMMSGGYGMGSGMMGGGYGMGPGMMGGGYGMGAGMMGMGPGMMGGWGYGLSKALNLNDEQRKKIQKIQQDLSDQQWASMQAMHNQMSAAYKKYGDTDDVDIDTAMKTQRELMESHLQMVRNRLEAQKKMREVLTKEQREKLSEMYQGW